jgi:hypothetical protein
MFYIQRQVAYTGSIEINKQWMNKVVEAPKQAGKPRVWDPIRWMHFFHLIHPDYRPNDHCMSDKLVPPLRIEGQRDGALRPYSRLSRPELLLFLPSNPSTVLARLSGPRSRPTTSQTIFRKDLSCPTVKEEIRRYSSHYGVRLRTHPNHLAVNPLRLPDNRRLRRFLPTDLPDRF